MGEKKPESCLSVADFDRLIVSERPDLVMNDGVVRLYRLPNGYGLNGINSPHAHFFSYAWEFSVLEHWPEDPLGFGDVVFNTPLTSTVKICCTDSEAADFLNRAVQWANGQIT